MTPLTARLQSWLNAIPIQDPIRRRMAALLQVILLGFLILIILVTLVLFVVTGPSAREKSSLLAGNLIGFLVVLLPFVLLRRGYFHGSILSLIAVLMLTPTLAILVVFDLVNNGGVLFQFTLAIFLAGLLTDRRILVLVFGLSAVLVVFSAFQAHGPDSEHARSALETALNFIIFNGLITLLLDRFGSTLRVALTDALLREGELESEINYRKQAEGRFQNVVESAPDAILLVDRRGKIMLVNSQAEKFFGYDRAQLVGSNVDRLVPERFRHGHADFRIGFLSDPQTRPMGVGRDLHGLRSDGSEFPVEIGLTPVDTHDGLMVVASIVDITDRKRAEEEIRKLNEDLEDRVRERTAELAQANALLQAMMDNVPDHIFFKDRQSRFLRNSRSQALMMGLSDPQDTVGKSDFDFFPHAKRAFDEEQQVMSSGKPIVDLEEFVAWPDGRTTWVSTTKVPLRNPEGEIIGIFGIARDITERKHVEESLRNAKEQAEAANKELEAFSYSVSHDLRAPLRAINGFTRILLEDYESQLDSEAKRLFNVVRHEARRMGELIDDLLTFSRLGRAEMRFVSIDMQTMVDNVFSELTTPEARERIDFRLENLPTAMGDPGLIRQVWVNLVSNAIKFTSGRERAVIDVSGTQNEVETTYTIRDNGAGFDMDYADKLFGVFQRLHGEAEFEGTGVGLAIVQRVILRHGGRVRGEGVEDQGAVFQFALPRKGETS